MSEIKRKRLTDRLQSVQEQLQLHLRREEIVQELERSNHPDIERPGILERQLHKSQLQILVLTEEDLRRKLHRLEERTAERQRARKTLRDHVQDVASNYEASKDNMAAARDRAAAWYRKHYAPNLKLPDRHQGPDREREPVNEHSLEQQNSLLRRARELKERNKDWEHHWAKRQEARDKRQEQREIARTERNEARRLKEQQQDYENSTEGKRAARDAVTELERELDQINRQIADYSPKRPDNPERNRERER